MTKQEKADIEIKILKGEYLLSQHNREHWECEYGLKHSEPMPNGRCKWCGELVKDT